MSDTMLFGILRMPFDLAMSTPTSRLQYHQRGQQAADEIERLRAENEMLIVTVTMIERMAAGAIYSQEAIHASAIGALKQLGGKP